MVFDNILGENEFSIDTENTGENAQLKLYYKSKSKIILYFSFSFINFFF